MELDSLYQEVILDHYKHPQHKGLSSTFDAQVHHVNTSCGDEITLNINLDGDSITSLSWDGQGCSISQASVSIIQTNSGDNAAGFRTRQIEVVAAANKKSLGATNGREFCLRSCIAKRLRRISRVRKQRVTSHRRSVCKTALPDFADTRTFDAAQSAFPPSRYDA